MRARALGWLLGAVGVAAAVTVVPSVAAPGDGIGDVGWWSTNPLAQPVADGGFEVAADPSGVQSFAAVEVRPTGSVSRATLRLRVASTVGSINVRLCSVFTDVVPSNPGPADEAPDYDCTLPVPVAEGSDADTLVADITDLVGDEEVRLAVVPAPSAVAFQAVFAAAAVTTTAPPPTTAPSPAATSPTTAVSGSTGSGAAAGSNAGVGAGSPVPAPVFPPSLPPTDTGALAALTLPTDDASDASTVPAPDARLEPAPLVDPGPATSFEVATLAARPADTKPWGRLVLLIPLCAAIGVGVERLRAVMIERGLVAS